MPNSVSIAPRFSWCNPNRIIELREFPTDPGSNYANGCAADRGRSARRAGSARRAFIRRGGSARGESSTAADGRDGRELVVRCEHAGAIAFELAVDGEYADRLWCDLQRAQHVVDRRAVGHLERASGG